MNYCPSFNVTISTSINISITFFQVPMKITKCTSTPDIYYEKYG